MAEMAETRIFRQEHAHLRLEAMIEGKDPVTGEAVVSIPGTFTMEGVMNGAYKPASEVENPLFWRYFDGLPFRLNHPPPMPGVVTANSELAGYVDRPKIQHKKGRPIAGGWVNIYSKRDNGKRALQLITELGQKDVSIGFWTTPNRKEGTYHDPDLNSDVPYFEIETDSLLDHLALVDKGACSQEMGCGLRGDALEEVFAEFHFDSPANADITIIERFKTAAKAVFDRVKETGSEPDPHKENENMCDEKALKEKADLTRQLGELNTAKAALEAEKVELQTELDEEKATVAELLEERAEEQRGALLARLEEAFGARGDDLVKALRTAKILEADKTAEDLDVEDLEMAVKVAEYAATSTKPIASGPVAGKGDGAYTVGIPGEHFGTKKED